MRIGPDHKVSVAKCVLIAVRGGMWYLHIWVRGCVAPDDDLAYRIRVFV